VYCDNVAVLDSEIVPDHTVHPGASIIKIIVRQDDQYCIFSLLALYKDGISPKELQRLHSVVREGDDRIIVVDCICNAVATKSVNSTLEGRSENVHQRVWLLLFLQDGGRCVVNLRIAVSKTTRRVFVEAARAYLFLLCAGGITVAASVSTHVGAGALDKLTSSWP